MGQWCFGPVAEASRSCSLAKKVVAMLERVTSVWIGQLSMKKFFCHCMSILLTQFRYSLNKKTNNQPLSIVSIYEVLQQIGDVPGEIMGHLDFPTSYNFLYPCHCRTLKNSLSTLVLAKYSSYCIKLFWGYDMKENTSLSQLEVSCKKYPSQITSNWLFHCSASFGQTSALFIQASLRCFMILIL